jgi:hypothetical protein
MTNNKNETIFEQDARKKRNKIIAGLAAAVLLIGGATTSVFLMDPFGGDQTTGSAQKNVTSTQDDYPVASDEEIAKNEKAQEEFEKKAREAGEILEADEGWAEDKYPVKIGSWQESNAKSLDDKGVREGIEKKYLTGDSGQFDHFKDKKSWKTDPGVNVDKATTLIHPVILPSEENGYITDTSKMYNEDGSINLDFSYWTHELFVSEVGYHVEKLINPTFGGWGTYQYPENGGSGKFILGNLSDSFSEEWLERFAESGRATSFVPVFADTKGNNYGRDDLLKTADARWYGTVVGYNYNFIYDDEKMSYTADATFDVVFTAMTTDKKKVHQKGTLQLKLVPKDTDNKRTPYRVLIDDATLTMR